jgi:dihydrofolate reductase
MGRRTYDKILSFGIPFPYPDKRCIVLSRTRIGQDDNVRYHNGGLADLIQALKAASGKDIYVDGGPELMRAMLQAGLLDKIGLSIIPVLLGAGIRLFEGGFDTVGLRLEASKAYDSGLVQLWYGKA